MPEELQPQKIPLIFYRSRQGQRACTRVAEGTAGSRAPGHRERPIAGAMALAGRDAAVPPVGKRAVGGPDGPADETDGARAALSFTASTWSRCTGLSRRRGDAG